MSELIKTLFIEWLKVKNYRTFWILLAIIVICVPAFNYVIFDFTNNTFPKFNGQSILGNPFSFPYVWITVPYNAGLLLFMPAILIITLLTNEYTYRTHRQNIIDGWSRPRFIYVKIVEIFLLALFVTGVVITTCVFFGILTAATKQPAPGWDQFRYVLYFFVEMLDYSMIAFLIAMLVRRAGLAIGIFFLYMIFEQFVVSLARNKYQQTWVNYLPEEVTDRLIPQPFARKFIKPENTQIWENHVSTYLTIAVIYLFVYIIIISWRFRKSDL
jgi:ABC-2 type transport system permease protein